MFSRLPNFHASPPVHVGLRPFCLAAPSAALSENFCILPPIGGLSAARAGSWSAPSIPASRPARLAATLRQAIRQSPPAPRIRLPHGLAPAPLDQPVEIAAAQLLTDRDTLREIAAGFGRLEERVDRTRILAAAVSRGYFTPDEDDRVRQALLAYRNYRLAAYEIIFRYRDYGQIADERRQLCGFLLAFGAALLLYEKSLKILQVVEHAPAVRAKLNEADPSFDLEAGFFEDVVMGYSSLANYRALIQGDRFWREHRRTAFQLQLAADSGWAWLYRLICRKRRLVSRRLADVLWQRLRHDWRKFCQTALQPARKTRDGLQNLLGGGFAGIRVVPHAPPRITPAVLGALRPLLQPGDVLLCRAEGKLTAALLPGFWSHAAIFLGSRADVNLSGASSGAFWKTAPYSRGRRPRTGLAAAGDNPAEASFGLSDPLRIDQLNGPAGAATAERAAPPTDADSPGFVIEAVSPRVRIATLATCLRADHVVVLRPKLPPGQIGAALREALRHVGKPYDYEFDFNSATRVVCTELVYRCYHRRGGCTFPLVKRLGRFTLTGDDIVNYTLTSLEKSGHDLAQAPLRPVAMHLLRRDGQMHAVATDRLVPLLQRIRHGWRPARRAAPAPPETLMA